MTPLRTGCFLFGWVVLSSALAWGQPEKPSSDEKPDKVEKKPISILVEGEVTAEMIPVAGKMVECFFECYPRLIERFEHPERKAPRQIRLIFQSNVKVPAYNSGDRIVVSVEWLRKNPNDIGMLTHELTHAVQRYPQGGPGWFTEGLADYARLAFGPKVQPNWELPKRLTEKNKYTDSYRVTGRFLEWLDSKHPGVVDKLHRTMQEGRFDLANFETFTGKSIDVLWKDCVEELSAK